MELARYVVEAVVLEGSSCRAVGRAYGVSKSWVAKLVGRYREGPNVMQTELLALGIDYRHSRPYHPQTCGKVERFHQTMKSFLARQPRAASVSELQARWTGSSPTTTTSGPTGRGHGRRPEPPSRPGTKRGRRDPGSGSAPACGSAGIGSTRTAR